MSRTSRKIKNERRVTESGPGFSRSGFSLIEVLISLVILSVGLLAVAQMQVSAIRGIAFSRHMTSATYLARQQMEFLRSLPYDDDNPDVSPTSAGGGEIKAKTTSGEVSVFKDDKNGTLDGKVCGDEQYGSTLVHTQNPLNEQGEPAGDGGGGEFYVIWKVQRGFTNVCTGVDAFGPGQMFIEMQVIWWETPEDMPSSPNFSTTSWDALQATHAHRVMLTTLRQHNL